MVEVVEGCDGGTKEGVETGVGETGRRGGIEYSP